MENTESFTPEAAAEALLAALLIVLEAVAVAEVSLAASPDGFVASLVSDSAKRGSEEADWVAEGVGLGSEDVSAMFAKDREDVK